MTFKDVYKPPFVVKLDGIYAFSSNGTKTFTAFSQSAQEHLRRIVKLLNGESEERYNRNDVVVQDAKMCICGDIILVRGWGLMVGQGGGLAIPREEAIKLQDGFIQWVIDTITYRG